MAFITKLVTVSLFLMISQGLMSETTDTSFAIDSLLQNAHNNRIKRSIIVSEEFKKVAVESHNKARFNVNPPASNMQNMEWNDDLAITAQHYGDKCIWAHNDDRTRETKNKIWKPEHVGENLYYTTAKLSDEEVMALAVTKWDAEKKDYDYETATCAKDKVCGHYTQVVWHNSVYVGCGISYCPGKNNSTKRMITCNYGPGGNYRGEAPYTKDEKSTDSDDNSDSGSKVNPDDKADSGSTPKPDGSGVDNEVFECDFETDLCGMTSSGTWQRGAVDKLTARFGESYLYVSGKKGMATINLPKYYGDDNGKSCVTLSIREIKPTRVKKATKISVGGVRVATSNLGWMTWNGQIRDTKKEALKITVNMKYKGQVVALDNIKVGKCT